MLCFLKDFLPHMLKKLHMLQTRSPYVAHMQPICGPYVSAAVVKVETGRGDDVALPNKPAGSPDVEALRQQPLGVGDLLVS